VAGVTIKYGTCGEETRHLLQTVLLLEEAAFECDIGKRVSGGGLSPQVLAQSVQLSTASAKGAAARVRHVCNAMADHLAL
jgi:hypothetical protein